jgi:hypothetical protein
LVPNVFLRDLNLPGVRLSDGRRLEVLAANLPCFGGAQLAVDCTLVSPVHRNGQPRARAAAEDGVALEAARRRKEAKYWEFLHSRRCHLVVAAMKIGGRWNEKSYDFLVQLAYNKAQTVPAALRRSMAFGMLRRWVCMLSVAAQASFAGCLLGEGAAEQVDANDLLPPLGDCMAEDRSLGPAWPSTCR